MLVTFIILQRKSILAIATAVEALATQCGRCIQTDLEVFRTFPTPHELKSIQKVLSGVLDLRGLAEKDDEYILDSLQQVHGVGKRVENCVSLFAYGRTSCVPVDVWISRAVKNECKGISPFHLFNENAGIIQQYSIFFIMRNVISTDICTDDIFLI